MEMTALLPVSDAEALFLASLSSHANPFAVTYAPYGGSGFIGILANVECIIGFGAGFEFGGPAAFAAGPLLCTDWLISGVYIRQLRLDGLRITDIPMAFCVGGSAPTWRFPYTASPGVKPGMVDGIEQGECACDRKET